MTKWPIIADCVCWILLVGSMFIGPTWITKVAVTILAGCHVTTVLMIYKMAGMYPSQFRRVMEQPVVNWDN